MCSIFEVAKPIAIASAVLVGTAKRNPTQCLQVQAGKITPTSPNGPRQYVAAGSKSNYQFKLPKLSNTSFIPPSVSKNPTVVTTDQIALLTVRC